MNTSENINKEVSLTDSNTESQINSDVSETESKIMEGVTNQSTPIPVKKDDSYEMLKMIQTMLDMKFKEQNVNINSRFDVNDRKFDVQNNKFDELNTNMNEQKK